MKKPGFAPEDFPSLESGRGYSHGHPERTKFTGGDIAKLPGSPEKGSDVYVSHKGTGAGWGQRRVLDLMMSEMQVVQVVSVWHRWYR